ncbi:hypothetical protein CKO31_10760 [Thiohalocapsa halophila]|uniref:Uncharacterized protein n=1 Tax=Thiohalocapsa halophila TaxID=69359 RepID=A0ABS1CH71_9GAMM|nr:hypothetical protein [Thiohalocapsa halophila]MBK1631210.1 hypothetical protein [Thiohalocapsa halophila]
MDLERFAQRFGRHRPQPADAPSGEAAAGNAPAEPPAGPEAPAAAPTPGEDTGAPPAWLEARIERAAIMQHDGGLSSYEAERRAALLHPDPAETRPDWCGLTAGELMAAAGPDWPEIADRPEVLAALALALSAPPAEPDPEPEPTPTPVEPKCAAPVTCAFCRHFRRNRTNPAAGFGACRIQAPASRRPPTLWPNARHACRDHQPRQPHDE